MGPIFGLESINYARRLGLGRHAMQDAPAPGRQGELSFYFNSIQLFVFGVCPIDMLYISNSSADCSPSFHKPFCIAVAGTIWFLHGSAQRIGASSASVLCPPTTRGNDPNSRYYIPSRDQIKGDVVWQTAPPCESCGSIDPIVVVVTP